MGRYFQPARFPAGEAPSIQEMAYTTGQTFKMGALVVLVSAGTISECGADPAAVTGVALQGAATNPGYDAANSPTVITGQQQTASIALANAMTVFSGRGVNGGTDPVTPTQTMIGESYGVAKVGNDWVIDISDTSNLVVKIVDIDVDLKVFFFKFLSTVIDLGA